MDAFICTACGMQYAPSSSPPPHCAICEEERQYVPPGGQTWTTPARLAAGHFNSYREYEPGIIGIGTQPTFAIGQRALLVRTAAGNVLWDCIAMLDPATIERRLATRCRGLRRAAGGFTGTCRRWSVAPVVHRPFGRSCAPSLQKKH